MKMASHRQPFAWSESRPDGRRHIRSHHQAHGRAVRSARKVVDTSPPRCFRVRLARHQQAAGNQAASPGAPVYHPALQPTVYSNSSTAVHDDLAWLQAQSQRPPSAQAGGAQAVAGGRSGAATMGQWAAQRPTGPVTVTSQRGSPVPGATADDGAAAAQHAPTAADDADVLTSLVLEEDGASDDGGDDMERLSYSFDDGQMAIFDSFVGLLSQFPRQDMDTIVAAALQEADERQLLANYRS
eukprot:TRINITY_DN24016_c0_g1_i1.p1 TRINITY_DN24016_c0_g1~~TRINITY_DN24016_c0_g1_i1.p1  ORF type:complete len:241 (+),score=78.46 TRINITY_DN24016_c0_g1_i1:65-787(+)